MALRRGRQRLRVGGVGWIALTAMTVVIVVAGAGARAAETPNPVGQAFGRAHAAGSYQFVSDIEQVTSPLASSATAGRSSTTEHLHLEGSADLKARETEFTLWSGAPSVHSEATGIGFRMEDGKTWQRVGQHEWVESAAGSTAMAPQGDPMGYLLGAREVVDLGPGSGGGTAYTRYGFEVDGGELAAALAREVESSMRDGGELPPGARVQAPLQFRDMVGAGELWVDDGTGLPLRQVLTVEFAPQGDEVVSARITADFDRYGFASGAASGSSSVLPGVLARPIEAAAGVAQNVVPLAVVLLVGVLLWRRQPAAMQGAVAVVLALGVLIGGPLASSASALAVPDRADGSALTPPSSQEEEQSAALHRRARAHRPDVVDPHLDRRALAAGRTASSVATADVDTDGDGLSDQEEQEFGTDPNAEDSDGDGLTDFEEVQLDTDPLSADTDGDGYSDLVELEGFVLSGAAPGATRWYPDPNKADSNDDGIPDSIEWDIADAGVPGDTDGDGIPDLFDEDNDEDGVSDQKDLAPFTGLSAVFTQDDPMSLQLQGLTTGKLPTFVDFQLRPGNPDHLRYALRPMDWPEDDIGQIRDVDNAPDDLSLVPMLEIGFPTGAAVVPDAATLAPYSIRLDQPDDPRTAYVPLSLATDQRTGERVAFNGRMRYQTPATGRPWGGAHQVRMVWAVRVDNDLVCDPDDPTPDPLPSDPAAAVDAVCGADGYIYNRPQTVHSYYGSWSLTGLKVTEEHGSQVASIFEDPAEDDDLDESGPTWALADVLSQRFLSAQPTAGGDYVYGLDFADLERFDHTSDASDDDRYALPDIFSVVSGAGPTFEDVMRSTTETVYDDILPRFGTAGVWNPRHSQMPLVMTAYTSDTRTLTLDHGVSTPAVSWSGSALAIDMAAGIPLDHSAGITWASFCGGTASDPVWSRCEIEQVAERLENRYDGFDPDPDDPTVMYDESANGPLDPDIRRGQDLVMMAYYLAVANGVSTVVRTVAGDGTSSNVARFDVEGDPKLRAGVNASARSAKVVAQFTHNKMLENSRKAGIGGRELYKLLGKQGTVSTVKRIVPKGLLAAFIVVSIVAVGVAIAYALDGDPTAQVALKVVAGVAGVVASLSVFVPFTNLVRTWFAGAAVNLLGSGSKLLQITAKATAIGTVILVGVVWGFFIHSMVSNGVRAGTPEFNQALSTVIATTIYIVLLAVLTLVVVGVLVVAVVSAIDGILSLICEVGSDRDKAALTVDGQCFTIGGSVITGIAKLLYTYQPMIDLGRDDLMVIKTPEDEPMFSLVQPQDGYIQGNRLGVALDVTTNIAQRAPDVFGDAPDPWLYSKSNLISTTFQYSLTSPSPEDVSARRGDMRDDWDDPSPAGSYYYQPLHQTKNTERVRGTITFESAGRNQAFPFHLNMGHATPAIECWSPYLIPAICSVETISGTSSSPFDPVHFDVLPRTIDEFLATTPTNGGERLAWDSGFSAIRDLDGDGLLSRAHGGLDRDDTAWDQDHDGLSDAFELDRGAGGQAFSPSTPDTDGDGLSDAQEARLGTDPAVGDSDRDGLTDAEEVRHMTLGVSSDGPAWNEQGGPASDGWAGGWEVLLGTTLRPVLATSDPLNPDTDFDGVGDEAEKFLADAGRNDPDGRPFHPRFPNRPPITIDMTTDAVGGFVASGQTVAVDTHVTALTPLAPSVVDVSSAFGDPVPGRLEFDPDPAHFAGSETITHREDITVPSGWTNDVAFGADVRGRLIGPMQVPDMRLSPQPPRPAMNASNVNGYVDVTAIQPGSPNSFLMVDEAHNGSRNGSVWPRTPGTSFDTTLELDQDNDTTVTPSRSHWKQRKSGGVSTACTAAGECMTVWPYNENCMTLTVNTLKVISESDANDNLETGIYLNRRSANFDRNEFEQLWHSVANGPGSMAVGASAAVNRTTQICGFGYLAVIETDDENRSNLTGCDDKPDNQTNCKPLRVVPNDSTGMRELILVTGQGGTPLVGSHTVNYKFSGCPNDCDEVELSYTLTAGDPSAGGTNGQIQKLAGAVTAGVDSISKTQFEVGNVGSGVHDVAPAIASDGNSFLLVWTRTTDRADGRVDVDFMHQRFDRNGIALEGAEPYELAYAQSKTAAIPSPSVFWSRGRQPVVVVNRPEPAGADWRTVKGLQFARQTAPDAVDIAGDPQTGMVTAVYESNDGIGANWFRTDASGVSDALGNRRVMMLGSEPGFTGLVSPQVAFDPLTAGWVISALYVGAGQADVLVGRFDETYFLTTRTPRGNPSAPATPGELVRFDTDDAVRQSLACESGDSTPVVELRFEELPGANEFVDSSRVGNDGTRSVPDGVLPAAGFGGGPAPDSNFAAGVRSPERIHLPNATGPDVSLAFWVRKDPGSQPFNRNLFIGGIDHDAFRLSVATHYVGWSSGGNGPTQRGTGSVDRPYPLDGDWHHIVATRSSSTGKAAIFVDGDPWVQGAASGTPVSSQLQIGGDGVLIDHFQMFDRALSATEVTALVAHASTGRCVLVAAERSGSNGSRYPWTELLFDPAEDSVALLTATASLNLRVDDTAPVTEIVALPGPVAGSSAEPRTVVVSGTASDEGAGIGRVEVSVDRGPWMLAQGLETWTYPLEVTDGTYEVRARAVDAVGHEGYLVTTVVTADGAPPDVTLDSLPADPIIPTPGASGGFVAGLAGTVADARTSVPADGVEVQLVPAPSDAASVESGWQSAAVTGGTWTIDYEFSATADDVSGPWDVRVRAVDQVGNVSPHDAPAGLLHLDSNAPLVGLSVHDTALQAIGGPGDLYLSGQALDPDGGGVETIELALTPLATLLAMPPGASVADLPDAPTWFPATVPVAGPGVTEALWMFQLPSGLEDAFQVDVRATDVLGNQAVRPNIWRGVLDTMAPRLTLDAAATGEVHSGGRRFEVDYRCRADDLFLDPDAFDCDGGIGQPAVRAFELDADVQAEFPDLTALAQMTTSFSRWERAPQADVGLTACDRFGNCSTSRRVIDGGGQPGPLSVSVVDPTDGQHVAVASAGSVDIIVLAGAVASLRSLVVLLDGVEAARRNFVQDQAVTFAEVIPVAVSGGNRTVEVRVTDWAGATELSEPVEYFADVEAPELTVESTEITAADTWGPTSPMIRFHGKASDDGTLASVEVKVDSGEWSDVIFDGVSWRGAIAVPDAERHGARLEVRATDLAGRATVAEVTTTVDLGPGSPGFERPDAVITEGPASSDSADRATFSIATTPGSNEIAGLECRLDRRAPGACTSPWHVSELSAGPHRLEVTAIDASGYRDLSPATWEWFVDASGPEATIVDAPSDPTPARSARLSFTSDRDGTFECSLDGRAFEPCSSPVPYDDLAVGPHRFEVRARALGEVGTPAAHRWNVVNRAPLVETPQFRTYGDDLGGTPIPLRATDVDLLTYRIVDRPTHGLLEGSGANRRYVPFDGYRGMDQFTYRAFDGDLWSDVATVTLASRIPEITWDESAPIGYGTALSWEQLNATASLPGTFSYTPDDGAVLPAGTHTLTVTFTPENGDLYDTSEATTTIEVIPADLTVTASSVTHAFGTPAPAVTPDFSGFVDGDGPDDLDEAPVCFADSGETSAVGVYATRCDGAAGSDYVVVTVDGVATVAQASTTLVVASAPFVRSLWALSVTFDATLTSDATGTGIGDEQVRFTYRSGATACTAVTDASGRASCRVGLPGFVFLLITRYHAHFDGTSAYAASSDSARARFVRPGASSTAASGTTPGFTPQLPASGPPAPSSTVAAPPPPPPQSSPTTTIGPSAPQDRRCSVYRWGFCLRR